MHRDPFRLGPPITTRALARLSLCQRERIKVRIRRAPLLQRKPDRLQDAVEFSAHLRIPKPQHKDPITGPEIPTALDREFVRHDSYARNRLVRSRALRPDNRNPGCSSLMDAGGEICNLQNFGSTKAAKVCAQCRLPSFAKNKRDSQEIILLISTVSRKANQSPLTLVLSP